MDKLMRRVNKGSSSKQQPQHPSNPAHAKLTQQQVQKQFTKQVQEVKVSLQEFGMGDSYPDATIEKAVMASLFDNNKTIEILMAGEAEKMQRQPSSSQAKAHSYDAATTASSAENQSVIIQGKEWQDVPDPKFRTQQDAIPSKLLSEPLPATERERDSEAPSGLKNVGNTCYFASLMQTLVALPNLQEKILNFDVDSHDGLLKNLENPKVSSAEKKKFKKSRDLVKALQEMMARMLLSQVKYQNPIDVLTSIVDDRGEQIPLFEQQDIGEFFLNFLERLQEGLSENKQLTRKLMSDDLVKQAAKEKKANSLVDPSAFEVDREEEIDLLFQDQKQRNNSEKVLYGEAKLGEDPYDPINLAFQDKQDQNSEEADTEISFDQPVRQSLYEPPRSMESFYVRHQSVVDPDSDTILMNYDLDKFKNSLWENFLGSQVEISYLIDSSGERKIANQNVNKMGPIQLRVTDDNLLQAWERTLISEIGDFWSGEPGQRKVIETWICRPPNVLLFQINRVNFDRKTGSPEKDNRRFDFEQTIYLDMFLNANKEKSRELIKRLDQLQPRIAQLKEALAQDKLSSLAGNFSACEEALQKAKDGQEYMGIGEVEKVLKDEVLLEFEDSGDLPKADELAAALKVLTKVKGSILKKKTRIEEKIKEYEQEVASKYKSLKERPYYLHAIIIHDGLATNGHYFVYIFDRVRKTWWKISDHLAERAPVEQVMADALGANSQYRNAANLVYINQQIADQIDSLKAPAFSQETSNITRFKIKPTLIATVASENSRFLAEKNKYIATDLVEQIRKEVDRRMEVLERQESQYRTLITLKLYSFTMYLKAIGFKGYTKWVTISHVFEEKHPKKAKIMDLQKQGLASQNPSSENSQDPIFTGLAKYYSPKFLLLTSNEAQSIAIKQEEYRMLLSKVAMAIFLLQNMEATKIKDVLSVYHYFGESVRVNKNRIQNYEQRIGDLDSIPREAIKIFLLRLLINFICKAKSNEADFLKEAYYSARLFFMVSKLLFGSMKTTLTKQMEQQLHAVTTTIQSGGQVTKDAQLFIELELAISQGVQGSLLDIQYPRTSIPSQVEKDFAKIKQLDCLGFVDGLGEDNLALQYQNTMNCFKNENAKYLKMSNYLHSINQPVVSEAQFISLLQKFGIQTAPVMFPPGLDFEGLVG